MTENDVEQVLLDVQQSRREEATAAARLAEIRDGLHELGWSSSVSVSGPDRSLGDKLQLLALQQPTMLRELEKVVDHLLKGRRKPDTWALVLGMMSLGVN